MSSKDERLARAGALFRRGTSWVKVAFSDLRSSAVAFDCLIKGREVGEFLSVSATFLLLT